MSVQWIDRYNGYQARAHLWGRPDKRLTKFVAADSHGGREAAYQLALRIEQRLKIEAQRLRSQTI